MPNVSEMQERIAFLMVNLVGMQVQVKLKNGDVYEGIYHAGNLDLGGSGVALKMARKITDELSSKTVAPDFMADGANVVYVTALDVDMTFADRGILSDRQGFQTDTGISGAQGDLVERELQPWTPDTDGPQLMDMSLDSKGTWDQFATNEKLFGVKTDYDEALYTTQLDRNSEQYRKKERDAMRLAREIEKSTANNVHMAEERGQVVDEKEMDEEDRYGAVVRGPGSYKPPALRKKQQAQPPQNDQAKLPLSEVVKKSLPAQETKLVPVEKKEPPKEKPKLNPNAPSFSLNAAASEFIPSFDATPAAAPAVPSYSSTSATSSTTSQQRPHQKPYVPINNFFGKRVRKLDLPVRQQLCSSFYRAIKSKSIASIGPLWPWGQRSHVQLFQAQEMMMDPSMAMMFPYYRPNFNQNGGGFPVMQGMQGGYMAGPPGAYMQFVPGYPIPIPQGFPGFMPMMPGPHVPTSMPPHESAPPSNNNNTSPPPQ